MTSRKYYRKRPKFHVTAVQLDLDFDGFSYRKWNSEQQCEAGDWLVNNDKDVYTVKRDYFRDHYQSVSPGVYRKTEGVWAEIATGSGSIATLEGSTDYVAGDYLVFDRPNGGDGYAVSKAKFERMYEEVDKPLDLTPDQRQYIQQRVRHSIDVFKARESGSRRYFYFWQMIAIVSAALVPVLTGFVDVDWKVKFAVAALGGVSAVSAGLLSLFKFQENWVRARSTAEDLETQLTQFTARIGIYADERSAFDLFAENCENILKAELGQWVEARKPTEEKDSSE